MSYRKLSSHPSTPPRRLTSARNIYYSWAVNRLDTKWNSDAFEFIQRNKGLQCRESTLLQCNLDIFGRTSISKKLKWSSQYPKGIKASTIETLIKVTSSGKKLVEADFCDDAVTIEGLVDVGNTKLELVVVETGIGSATLLGLPGVGSGASKTYNKGDIMSGFIHPVPRLKAEP